MGIEECEKATKAVSTAFDVEDFIPHEYSLEVSSPGLNRPLKKRNALRAGGGQEGEGEDLRAALEPPRKNFAGVLKAVSDEAVTVQVEGAGEFVLPFKEIAKANLEFEL